MMKRSPRGFLLGLCLIATAVRADDDGGESLRSWAGLNKVSVAELAEGKILTKCNASMDFSRGIFTKSAYFVDAPVAITADVLLNTDPTKEPEREVYQYHVFQGESDAAFGSIRLDTENGPIRKLREATFTGKSLQLSAAESATLPKDKTTAAAQKFWADLMRARWKRAAGQGDLGSTSTYDTRSELRSMLGEEQKVAEHFSVLLTPISKVPVVPLTPARHCWYLSNVNGIAAVQLGAVFTRDVGESRQVLELTYYSSAGYLGSFSIYELTPVTVGDRKGTLVWQGSFASAVDLAGNFGLNRKIASNLMTRDVERSIRAFQKSAAAKANSR